MLKGKKTYLAIGLGLFALAARMFAPELVPAEVLDALIAAAFGGAAMGRKVARLED